MTLASWMAAQRPLSSVPAWVRWLLPLMLIAQIVLRLNQPDPTSAATRLGTPPSYFALRMAAIGEPIGLAHILTLRLQAFDMQPGISIPFRDMNYDNLVLWLERILDLDEYSQYPLLLASQLYSQVPDETKQRMMLHLVYQKFLEDPVHRWRWLAHGALIARHRLEDMQLALKYSQAIAAKANVPSVPSWAKQMHIFLLADLGEYEAAKVLLGGLLASGTIVDAQEQHFLLERLKELETVENSSASPKP